MLKLILTLLNTRPLPAGRLLPAVMGFRINSGEKL